MDLLTLSEIRRAAQGGSVLARVHVQVDASTAKTTRELKPYCELALADACDRMTLRVWNDHPAYKTCDSLRVADFVELYGEFQQHQSYGLDAKRWNVRPLKESEIAELLQGPADLRAKQAIDWDLIVQTCAAIADPRHRALCAANLQELSDHFRRNAA